MSKAVTQKSGGLAGVIAGQSAICTVGLIGQGLNYRGYGIADLSQQASFEEVAFLLIHGHLPNLSELTIYQQRLMALRQLPKALQSVLQQIPQTAHPMDVLRTACSMLGTLEPQNEQNPPAAIADRLLAILPLILIYWYLFYQAKTIADRAMHETSLAGMFLHGLHGNAPSVLAQDAMRLSLILYAEHEFNASTFAARVTAATQSDFYSAICSAIGTLRGNLHGGANEAAMALIQSFDNPNQAEQGIRQKLTEKALIMGFGHRVYTTCDPRSDIIKPYAEKLAQVTGHYPLFQIAERIEQVMRQEKQLFPNVDFYSAIVYHCLGIPITMFTPIFVLARISGWSAHVLEQWANNKLIRPASEYIGPAPKDYISLKDR